MKRPIVWALAAALLVPALASAQDPTAPPPPAARYTVSPFLGYAFGFTQKGTVHVVSQGGSDAADYNRHVGGGMMPGISFEYRLPGRFGAAAAVAYSKRGQERISTNYLDVAPLHSNGSTLWLAKVAATLELADVDPDMRLHYATAQLSAGPALLREVPDGTTGRAAVNSVALNVAATGEMPLPWKGFSVRGAFEDYIAQMPMTDVSVQLAADMTGQFGQAISADLSRPTVSLFVIRAGLSYRF